MIQNRFYRLKLHIVFVELDLILDLIVVYLIYYFSKEVV